MKSSYSTKGTLRTDRSPSPNTTIFSSVGQFGRAGAMFAARAASSRRTLSWAWLTMYSMSAGASRMLTVCNTAPEQGTAM
jgi:hypothetical protein